ncbi:ATP-binding protein [Streptomyces sp. NPDC013157]|uniref:ATP-binding protein n=1 Tax=Streptomyces sp. NPDC013157 TaxID=3364861 RepID=UPI0036B1C033
MARSADGYRLCSISHASNQLAEGHRAVLTYAARRSHPNPQLPEDPVTDSCPPGPSKPYDRYDSVSYTPFPQNIPRARRRVAQLAVAWGHHPGVAGDAALLASELCTNALLYGCLRDRLFRVETSLTGTALRVSVTDPRGERLPDAAVSAAPGDQSGRGLLIVRMLASRWSVEKLTVGKSVWAELDTARIATDHRVRTRRLATAVVRDRGGMDSGRRDRPCPGREG